MIKKSFTRQLLPLLVLLLSGTALQAQVTISGGTTAAGSYTSMSAATTALNGTALTGAVIISVTAPYTETSTITLGSATLNASTSSVKTITINGGNNLITARSGGVNTSTDGILKIQGTDYVNINNLSLRENSANTTPTTQMEWGIGIVKRSNTDGCKFINITNCTISLNRSNSNSSCIYGGNHLATSTAELVPLSTTGANGDIHINGCTLSNANAPIFINGYKTNFNYSDVSLEIGTTAGNKIFDFGYNNGYYSYGIFVDGQNSPLIENNTITTTSIAGMRKPLAGIYVSDSCVGIISINADTVSGPVTSGIQSTAVGASVTISNNSLFPNNTIVTSNNWLIGNDMRGILATSISGIVNITGNVMSGLNYTCTDTSFLTLAMITTSLGYSPTPTATFNITNNTLKNCTLYAPRGLLNGIGSTAANGTYPSYTISDNNIFNNKAVQTSAPPTITSTYIRFTGITAGTQTIVLNNNKIHHDSLFAITTATGGSDIIGLSDGSVNTTISNNEVDHLFCTLGAITGMYCGVPSFGGLPTTSASVHHNKVHHLLCLEGGVSGMVNSQSICDVSKNAIYDLASSGNNDNVVMGIQFIDNYRSVRTVKNNLISGLKSMPSGPSAFGRITGIYFYGSDTSTNKIYYNTIYLNDTSSGGIRQSNCIFSNNTDTFDVRNNILINKNDFGNAAVLNMLINNAGLTYGTTYLPASNNNLLYTSNPGPSRGILWRFSYYSMSGFQSYATPADTNSFTGEPLFDYAGGTTPFFLSTDGSDPNFLKPVSRTITRTGGGAAPIPGITDDYSGAARSTTKPDIGAWEFYEAHAPVVTFNSINPGVQQCTSTARIISVNATTDTGSITGVILNYRVNGVAAAPVTMTNVSGNTWTGTIPAIVPAHAPVTWSITATSTPGYTTTYTGTGYSDTPLAGFTATATASAASVCTGTADTLKALLPGISLFNEMFESSVPGGFTLSGGPGAAVTRQTTYYQQGNSSAYLNTSAVYDSAILTMAPSIDLTRFGSGAQLQLKWNQICGMEEAGTAYDFGFVEYSTNNGATWTTFPASSYAGSGTLFNAQAKFSARSYPDWTSVFATASALPNNSLWHGETINIPAAAISNQFKVRFRYVTDVTINYYGWLIDSVAIVAIPPTPTAYSWSDGSSVVGTTNPLVIYPATTKTYNATLTAAGCSITTNNVTVTTATAANASFTAPAALCVNATGTATPTNPGGIWTSSNTAIATVSNAGVITGIAPGTATIRYKVGSGNCVDSTLSIITINTLPNTTISGASSVCVSSVITLIPATTGGTWTSSTPAVATVDNSGNVTGIAAGTTVIKYKMTNASGCTDSSTKIIMVNPKPVIDITPNTAVICEGGSIALTATGGTSYQWFPPAGLNTTTGATVTASPSVNIRYFVSGTDANGCTNIDSQDVMVNPRPNPAVTGPSSVCVSNTIVLTPATTGGTWSSLSPAIAAVNNSGVVTGVAAGTATIKYVVTNAAGCKDSATKTITINALPNTTISGASSVCVNSGITLTPATTGGTWISSSPSVATVDNSGNVTGLVAGTTIIKYKLTNANGCTDSSTKMITVNAKPVIDITPNTAVICEGSSVVLTATGGISYQWLPPAGLNTTTGATVTASPSVNTRYFVSGTDANGCTNIDSQDVVVNPRPNPAISGASGVCVNSTITLTPATTGGNWSSSNTAVATISSGGVVTGITAGTTTIKYVVTNAAGCKDSATRIITVNALPNITVTPANAAVCPGGSVMLTANGANTYGWSPVTDLNTSAGAVVTATPANTITYTITGTDVNGCTNTTTKLVTVNPLPNVTITGAAAVCVNSTIALTPGSAGGTWTSSNTAVATVSNSGIVTGITAGTATIKYVNTTALGCKDSSTKSIAVNALPNVAISGASAVCLNSTITLTSASSGGNWISSDPSVATVSTGGVVTGIAAGSAIIKYINTNASGCTDSAARTITVNALPVIAITPATATICAGDSIALTASGGTSYSWSPATGLNTAIGATVKAGPGTTTTYTVTGIDANSCSSTATRSVTVNPLPVATISGAAALCVNATATLTPATTGGTWTSANTAIATVNNAGLITGIAPGTDTIRYRVTNANGCTDSAYKVITIHTLPDATISGPAGACINATATLTAATTGGTWTSTNTAIATISNTGVVTAISAGVDTIRYTVTNANGCTGLFEKVFIVSAQPSASITGRSALCVHARDTLTGLAAGGTWSSLNPAIATVDTAGHIQGIAAGTDTITYTVNVNGCTNTAIKVITVNALPVATITASGPLTFCDGDSVRLTAHAIATSYVWVKDAVLTTVADSVYRVRSTGNYRVITANAAGCSDTSTIVAVTVHPLPAPVITANGNILSTGTFATYQWYLNGSPITGATGNPYTATQNGSYTVVVTNTSSCAGTSTSFNLTNVSVGEHGGIKDVHVYPNPAHDLVYIDAPVPVNVTLYAADGRKIAYSEQVKQIDISRYAAGSYTLTITDKEGTFKVIKQIVKVE